jgi:hypothetical protein
MSKWSSGYDTVLYGVTGLLRDHRGAGSVSLWVSEFNSDAGSIPAFDTDLLHLCTFERCSGPRPSYLLFTHPLQVPLEESTACICSAARSSYE